MKTINEPQFQCGVNRVLEWGVFLSEGEGRLNGRKDKCGISNREGGSDMINVAEKIQNKKIHGLISKMDIGSKLNGLQRKNVVLVNEIMFGKEIGRICWPIMMIWVLHVATPLSFCASHISSPASSGNTSLSDRMQVPSSKWSISKSFDGFISFEFKYQRIVGRGYASTLTSNLEQLH